MKDKRFVAGLIFTVGWLGFSLYMLLTKKQPTELNAWGDFFAGFFAPLAFLWLVLGYLQQGEELRHSTEALRLQAEELKNSVEQQSQLVAVSREQMQQELRALEDERERRRDAARPKFIPQHSTTIRSGGTTEYKIKLVNVGNTATKFRMRVDPELDGFSFHNQAIVSNGEVISLSFKASPNPTIATINYVDADGLPGEVRFDLSAEAERFVIGEVHRVV
ncbi:hypothetical protein GCM10027046_20650 [Uliginosibacterium flavum]|uniref:Uncharacterized protein n=1 Tax=Uliginosibacterium flavum TaxID=1396831 RepID=A0ABV2TG38_9RHOO